MCSPEIEKNAGGARASGKTAALLDRPDRRCWPSSQSPTRCAQTSRQAIADLHSLGVGTLMLTGDNAPTAETITRWALTRRGNLLLPKDKLQDNRIAAHPPQAWQGWHGRRWHQRRARAGAVRTSASRWARQATGYRDRDRRRSLMDDDLPQNSDLCPAVAAPLPTC